MKNALIAFALVMITAYIFSCKKTENNVSCTGIKPVNDSSQLLSFASRNGITATADTSYLYYQIINQGTGAKPTKTSKVYVRYVAKFMDGYYLDSSATSVRFPLDSVILGWQYGIPKIQEGGHIKLLVPSALAYGCAGTYGVPTNSPLYFDVYLDSLR